MLKSLHPVLSAVLLFFVLSLHAPQAQAQLRAGGGLAWGSQVEAFGINLSGEYAFAQVWSVEPNFTAFFSEGDDRLLTLDLDAHYYFFESSKGQPYFTAGLNFSTYGNSPTTSLGLNLGIGYAFYVDRWQPFADLKAVLGGYDQALIRFGVRYQLGEGKSLL